MSNNIVIRKLALPTDQWASILKGAGIAVLGAAVAYLSQNLAHMDFGQYTYIVVPLVTVGLNVVRKVILHEPGNIIGSMQR